MPSLKLYHVLRRIPRVTDRSVQDAISEVVFRDEMKHVATKEDVANLETKIEKTAKLTIMWIIGTNTALLASLATTFHWLLK